MREPCRGHDPARLTEAVLAQESPFAADALVGETSEELVDDFWPRDSARHLGPGDVRGCDFCLLVPTYDTSYRWQLGKT